MPVLDQLEVTVETTARARDDDNRDLKPRPRCAAALLIAILLVLALGAVEDVYGNSDSGDIYGSDGVQYLDIARAIQHHDWRSVFNPLWSQGYPALLAVARPAFSEGPAGDWKTTRAVNFGIFTFDLFTFLYLFTGLMQRKSLRPHARALRKRHMMLWAAAMAIFVTTQVCLGQLSRVGPDELVSGMFFLVCGILLRLLWSPTLRPSRSVAMGAALGCALGIGFIVKAVFLVLGCGILAIAACALWGRRRTQPSSLWALSPVLIAALCFAILVGAEGIGLSRATGHPTLGESGSLNYAWHVNRLQKWVHWEGGNQAADEAWPRPAIARFAQWDTRPPDFGVPTHPSRVLQTSPLVYGFAAPVHGTYVPYFDPPYFYAGYHHLLRPRYQIIALGKNIGDLAAVLLKQPLCFALCAVLFLLLSNTTNRSTFASKLRQHWPFAVIGLLGIAVYLPVHLEGRYLAGFFTLLAILVLHAASQNVSAKQLHWASLLLVTGFAGELTVTQLPVWQNMLHHKSPQQNMEWKVGTAALAQGLPDGSQVGVIAWTPNLHCDWAYIAHLQITSEIATGKDFDLFWKLSPQQQSATLQTFRNAGAVAVFAYGKPQTSDSGGWRQLNGTPMWMYRL